MDEKPKKIRVWYCRYCGRCWHRKKKDKTPSIYCCGKLVVSGRHYPERKISRYDRKRHKNEEFKSKYWTKPRTNIGTVLQLSKETRRSFKYTTKAKTRPAFIRRANQFIQSICKDATVYKSENKNQYPNRWKKILNSDGTISKCRGSFTGFPTVIMSKTDMWSTKGEYSRAFMQGQHSITMNCKLPFAEWTETFAHETLHFIDALAEIPCDNHGYYWKNRLDKFKSMLKI